MTPRPVTLRRYAEAVDHALARHLFWLFTGAMLALAAIFPLAAKLAV